MYFCENQHNYNLNTGITWLMSSCDDTQHSIGPASIHACINALQSSGTSVPTCMHAYILFGLHVNLPMCRFGNYVCFIVIHHSLFYLVSFLASLLKGATTGSSMGQQLWFKMYPSHLLRSLISFSEWPHVLSYKSLWNLEHVRHILFVTAKPNKKPVC